MRPSWGSVKPPFGTPLIEGRLTRRLGAACLFNGAQTSSIYNAANPQYSGTVVGGIAGMSRYGSGIQFDATTDYVTFSLLAPTIATSGGFTAFMAMRKTDAVFRSSIGWGVEQGLARCASHFPWTDGKVYWDYGGAGAGFRLSTPTALTFGDDLFAFTTGPRGMEIWQNGILCASNTDNPTRTASTDFRLGNTSAAPSAPGDLAVYSLFYQWNRQLAPTEIAQLSRAPYDIFATPRRTRVLRQRLSITSGFTLKRALERIGSGQVHTLFELSVTHPIPKTWYLAMAPIQTPESGIFDPDTFVPHDFAVGLAGPRYTALVREHSGMSSAAASEGFSGENAMSLTLINSMGTWGPGHKFMDQFATPVPGYSVPYNLLTMTATVRLYSERAPGEPLTIGRRLALRPDGFEITAAPGDREVAHLNFGPDTIRYREVPQTILTTKRYSHLPEGVVSRALPTWFGVDIRVPMIPLDGDGSLFAVGGSALDTPNGAVTKLWTIREDIEKPEDQSAAATAQAWPVRITTGGEVVLTVAGNATNHVLRAAAQQLEVANTGAFLYGVRVWMKRAVSGTAAIGSVTLGLYTDEDGMPGSTLIDPAATAEVDAAIVPAGASLLPYDIFFQDAALQRAAYIFADKSVWLEITHTKNLGGDLHIELDSTGAYPDGLMATKATGTDEGWKLDGKKKKRKPVSNTFTGVGGLGRDVTTGEVTLRMPKKKKG